MDFTLKKYSELLGALKAAGYRFQPFCEFVHSLVGSAGSEGSAGSAGYRFEPFCEFAQDAEGSSRTLCLRHDVDLRPGNSLAVARLEAGLGIRATYYFRAVSESWDEGIIREIAGLGHEIGYHYESLTTCRGDVDAAYRDFCLSLERLRSLVVVQTICMHGSPRSPFDSKDIWKKYDYRSLGIEAEPYLDVDWSRTFYLTDTGRRWDGYNVSVRDKIPHWQDVWNERGLVFHSTDDIVRRVSELPSRVMITTHPQRWDDALVRWAEELCLQNAKNVVKMLLGLRIR